MGLSRYEQEFIIRWNRADDMAEAQVFSKRWRDALVAHGAKVKREILSDGRVVGWALSFPKTWVENRIPRPPRRERNRKSEAVTA